MKAFFTILLFCFSVTIFSQKEVIDSIQTTKIDTVKTINKKVDTPTNDVDINTDSKSNFWKRVKFGSGFGLNFLGGTNVSLTPNAIYNFDNGLSLGVGLNYAYSKVKTTKSNTFGGSLLSYYQIPKSPVQFSGEYELLRSNVTEDNVGFSNTTSSLFLGATYNIGKFALGFRYNLLYDKDKSPYTQAFLPVVRVSF